MLMSLQVADAVMHRHPPRTLTTIAALLCLLPLAITLASPSALPRKTAAIFARCILVYLLSFSASTTLWLLSSFHPHAQCPGLVMARITCLWVYEVQRDGKRYV
jgi:hypothetical protein